MMCGGEAVADESAVYVVQHYHNTHGKWENISIE